MGAAGTACRCAASAPDHRRRSPPAADRPPSDTAPASRIAPGPTGSDHRDRAFLCGPPRSSSGPPGEKIVLDRQPADLGVQLLDLPRGRMPEAQDLARAVPLGSTDAMQAGAPGSGSRASTQQSELTDVGRVKEPTQNSRTAANGPPRSSWRFDPQ